VPTPRTMRGISQEESFKMIESAVCFITQKCNMKCPYCIHGKLQKAGRDFAIEPFKPAEEWAKAINRINPKLLDFTGGEPFLQPNFVKLLEDLNSDIKVGLTTNASCDLTGFVQKISPAKVVSITCSFHPTSFVSFDMLLGKVLMLKHRGFNVSVNYVAYPEQLFLIPQYVQRFAVLGVRFHIDPYMQGDDIEGEKYIFSDNEKQFITTFAGQDRPVSYDLKENNKPVLCSAGKTHLSIHPNGDAWRCLNDRFNHKEEKRIGNIFDENFKTYEEDQMCYEHYRCCGCDRDKVTVSESKVALI